MKIQQDILDEILRKMPEKPPEKGGIIGGKNDKITIWEYDEGYQSQGCTYYPNVEFLNNIISDWIKRGFIFMGMVHVHFGGAENLSKGDKEYIEKILKVMPETIERLFFPIVVQPNKRMVVYVAKKSSTGEVLIEKENIEYDIMG